MRGTRFPGQKLWCLSKEPRKQHCQLLFMLTVHLMLARILIPKASAYIIDKTTSYKESDLHTNKKP